MNLNATIFALLVGFGAFAQFHDDNVNKINSVAEAKLYAERYHEVSFDIINPEKDVFLFDNVDTADLKASVGTTNTIYRRRTKFLKDTTITMLNVKIIEFDMKKVSKAEANRRLVEIKADADSGFSIWQLMKKYQSETCYFRGGPMSTDILVKRFGDTFESKKRNESFQWNRANKQRTPVLIIIQQEAHQVPAFFAISYNVAGN